ncbi:MAG TPA: polyprenyl diphosphate synthase [Candidatus Baltobacteraceae bacterium]|jgi:undecaprenyl diphosphate synthase|nr:polyprenyl diphosphate synthase [Candidatus Baltobacteraceae bacterium]
MAMQAAAPEHAPAHIALIMDGNRRWAAQHRVPAIEGHRRGVQALDETVQAALDLGVRALTVYGFSTDNWQRGRDEVASLMELCADFARTRCAALLGRGVRVRIAGDVGNFSFPARAALAALERATETNSRLTLNLALNYSGRAEIVRATRAIARDVAGGRLQLADVDETLFRTRLYSPELPDPDLLIRTGGDLRISNFLLYQLAYTELATLPVLWPDFSAQHFAAALEDFARRERRFGR